MLSTEHLRPSTGQAPGLGGADEFRSLGPGWVLHCFCERREWNPEHFHGTKWPEGDLGAGRSGSGPHLFCLMWLFALPRGEVWRPALLRRTASVENPQAYGTFWFFSLHRVPSPTPRWVLTASSTGSDETSAVLRVVSLLWILTELLNTSKTSKSGVWTRCTQVFGASCPSREADHQGGMKRRWMWGRLSASPWALVWALFPREGGYPLAGSWCSLSFTKFYTRPFLKAVLVWLLCSVLPALNTAWLVVKSLRSFYLLSSSLCWDQTLPRGAWEEGEHACPWWFAELAVFRGLCCWCPVHLCSSLDTIHTARQPWVVSVGRP